MRYLLDTNVIIRYLNNDPDTIQLLVTLAGLSSEPFAVSTVTQMEVWEGVHRATDLTQVAQAFQPASRSQAGKPALPHQSPRRPTGFRRILLLEPS